MEALLRLATMTSPSSGTLSMCLAFLVIRHLHVNANVATSILAKVKGE